jgi:uncharacterized protein YcfL
MKKYLLVAVMAFVIGCFSSSPKIVKDIINGTDSIKNSFESELVRIESEIKSISQSYKIEAQIQQQQKALMQVWRDKYEVLALELKALPASRGLSLALTKLEESSFWLNKAITQND